MNISIASDHAGFEPKRRLADYLLGKGCTIIDQGPDTDDRVDYPDYAIKVVRDVLSGTSERGVLVCGTGIGMAITANRFKGIRAVSVTDVEFARLAREHNDANVLCLSARFVDEHTNEAIIDAFLETEFGEGRHADRVAKIDTVQP